jgi:hypothetical protein
MEALASRFHVTMHSVMQQAGASKIAVWLWAGSFTIAAEA